MKFLCAPDSFKETLDAVAAARAMAGGIRAVHPRAGIDECPVADGGEGTLDALVAAAGGVVRHARVRGPLGAPQDARFAVADDGRLGIVELAEASGLAHVPPAERDPTRTTTYGTGELIARAADAGCTKIVVGVGGSGTCDGGAGLAQALGVRFLDDAGRPIEMPMTGGMLARVARVERPAWFPAIVVACDVRNPLLGTNGAAAVYGPQKGATREQVVALDAALAQFAARTGGDPDQPGAGAAGGAGYGLATFCHATLVRGIDLVLDAVRFDERCAGVDLVLTGEGRLDASSLEGKTAIGVARRALALGTPTIAIVGSTGPGAERCVEGAGGPLQRYVALTDRYGRERALSDTAACVADAAAHAVG